MALFSSQDVVILGLGMVLAAVYLFKDSIFAPSKPKGVPPPSKGFSAVGSGNPRDFVAKMKTGVSRCISSLVFNHR